MQVVYLDQNKWIQIARVAHGKEKDPSIVAAVDFIRTAAAKKAAVFPLSMAHYFETSKHSDPERRRRLADLMLEVSRGYTIASHSAAIRRELDIQLKLEFKSYARLRPFTLLGSGISHALGQDVNFKFKGSLEGVSSETLEVINRVGQNALELAALAGAEAIGGAAMRFDPSPQDLAFRAGLERLRTDYEAVPDNLKPLFLVRRCLNDIRPLLEEALGHHGLVMDDFAGLGPERWRKFFDAMASRHVDIQLSQLVIDNPGFKFKDSDLNDWAYLGYAAAYCDVVCCERHIAGLLNRAQFRKKARVVTSLSEIVRT